MVLSARMNGLAGEGMKPWHLKSTYSIMDGKGALKEQGVIEEFWAAHNKKRTIFTDGNHSVTVYETEQGSFQAGALEHPDLLAVEAEQALINPLPPIAYIERQNYEKYERKVGDGKLNCVNEGPAPGFQHTGFPTMLYCFSPDLPILRIDVSGNDRREVIRNTIVMFQGRYVPEELVITERDKTVLKLHLESLGGLSEVQNAEFVPPADAKPLPKLVQIPADVAQSMVINSVRPNYPEKAKAVGVTGTVVIRIRIDTDGKVHNPEIVSGPMLLQLAALDAVKDFVYRPYLLNGVPVEVDTLVNMTFNLAR